MISLEQASPLDLFPEQALLLVVDIQEKLIPTMRAKNVKRLVGNLKLLSHLAVELKIPVLLTEQYPKGLGTTIEPVQSLFATVKPVEKSSFSCCGDEGFNKKLKTFSGRNKIILVGMETHICIYLTALGLVKSGFDVFVPHDAVIAHKEALHDNGLNLIVSAGGHVTNTETVLFQLMQKSGTDVFKKMSSLLKESLAQTKKKKVPSVKKMQ